MTFNLCKSIIGVAPSKELSKISRKKCYQNLIKFLTFKSNKFDANIE
jgi:hypothetical protein